MELASVSREIRLKSLSLCISAIRGFFRLGLCCLVLGVSLWVRAEGGDAEEIPGDLAYRWAMFHYYQGDDLRALARFPENTSVLPVEERMQLHETQARFGLEAAARAGFQQIMRDFDGNISAKAAFELGKLEYLANQNEAALAAFGRINQLDRKLLPIYQRYHSAALLKQGDVNRAATLVSKMDEGLWAGYAYYNIARKYTEKDTNASRPLLALRVAEALNVDLKGTELSPAQADLSDRIFLASGMLALEDGDYDKARSFLDKILIDGAAAPEGLYLYGLSYFKQGQYRDAIQSWYRVKKYPLSNKGVSQAYSGISYAFLKSGNKVNAIESYLESIAVHEQEIRTLEEMQSTIRSIGFNNSMLKKSKLDNLDTVLGESVNTNTPKAAYLNYFAQIPEFYALMEDSVFTERTSEYLKQRVKDLSIFKHMLSERINGFTDATRKINAGKFRKVVSSAKVSIKEIDSKKNKAIEDEDFLLLASGQVQQQVAKVESLKDRALSIRAGEQLSAAEYDQILDKVNRIHGLLVWRAKELFELNIGNIEEDLRALDYELGVLDASIKRIEDVVEKGPVTLKARLIEVEQAITKTQAIVSRADTLLSALDKEMTKDALEELALRRKAVQKEYEIAQLTLAQLYETIAITGVEALPVNTETSLETGEKTP